MLDLLSSLPLADIVLPTETAASNSSWSALATNLGVAFIYAIMGIFILAVSFRIWDWLTPVDLWKEICEHKNMALAIMVAGLAIGISIIIAAAIH